MSSVLVHVASSGRLFLDRVMATFGLKPQSAK